MRKIKNLILIVLIVVVVSCKKDSSSDQGNFPFYFTATINGSSVKYQANDIDSRYGCGISQPEHSLWPDDFDIYEGTVILDEQDQTKNIIHVHILKYFNHEPTAAERVAMIQTGSYPYGVSDVSSSTINGAAIDYVDANGDAWDSQFGSQSGSTFTITELTNNPNGTSGKIFTATFSCKLYDGNGGNIQLTNATIRGKILSP